MDRSSIVSILSMGEMLKHGLCRIDEEPSVRSYACGA